MELFSSLHEEGNTIVIITHDSNVASRAQRIIHIEDGHVWEEGKEEQDAVPVV
jgi:putative ABC transport system ATP-binding protein